MTEYYISPTGSDSNNGLSTSTAWKGLNTSVQKLYAGDILWLMDGTWQEKISFPRSGNPSLPITLKRYNGTPTILHALPVSNTIPIFGLSNITIDGLTIKNTLPNNDNNAININNASSYINILNCKIYNTVGGVYYSGISFDDGCFNCIVDNCEVYGCMWNTIQVMGLSTGVSAKRDSHDIIIQNTVVHDNPCHNGFDLRGNCYNVTIQNCEAYGYSTPCLYTHQGLPHDCIIKNNIFHDSGDGIHADAGISNTLFEGNLIYNSQDSNGSLKVRSGANNTYRYNHICGLVGLSDSNPTLFCNNFTSVNQTPPCSPGKITSVYYTLINPSVYEFTINGSGFDSASTDQIYQNCGYVTQGAVTSRTTTQIKTRATLSDGLYYIKLMDMNGKLSNAKEITIGAGGCPPILCDIRMV